MNWFLSSPGRRQPPASPASPSRSPSWASTACCSGCTADDPDWHRLRHLDRHWRSRNVPRGRADLRRPHLARRLCRRSPHHHRRHHAKACALRATAAGGALSRFADPRADGRLSAHPGRASLRSQAFVQFTAPPPAAIGIWLYTQKPDSS